MRLTLDTNVVISGLFWRGFERSMLDAARDSRLELATSPVLLAELGDVLIRKKFTPHLERARTNAHALTLGYAALATVFRTPVITPVIQDDPDDDAVLACAKVSRSDIIVSGDKHLLALRTYDLIRIVSAKVFVQEREF